MTQPDLDFPRTSKVLGQQESMGGGAKVYQIWPKGFSEKVMQTIEHLKIFNILCITKFYLRLFVL